MAKANPERVNPQMAEWALKRAMSATAAYSEYIRSHFHATGSLAPGCDAKDLVAWYRANMPEMWKEKGGK